MQAHFEGWWGQDYEWAVRVEVWAGVKSGKSLNLKVRDWGFIWQKGTVFKARCDGMMGVFWEGNSENWTIHTGGNCGNEVNYEVVVCVHVCVCVCVCVHLWHWVKRLYERKVRGLGYWIGKEKAMSQDACHEHRPAGVFLNYDFLRLYAQKWDCWVIWKFYF